MNYNQRPFCTSHDLIHSGEHKQTQIQYAHTHTCNKHAHTYTISVFSRRKEDLNISIHQLTFHSETLATEPLSSPPSFPFGTCRPMGAVPQKAFILLCLPSAHPQVTSPSHSIFNYAPCDPSLLSSTASSSLPPLSQQPPAVNKMEETLR